MLSTRRLTRVAVLVAMLAGGAGSAFADVFNVSIDTNGLGGTGGIYLQFNPGLASDPASVVIDNFVISGGSGGLLSASDTPAGGVPAGRTGNVTGDLDNSNPLLLPPLILSNVGPSALNDYLRYLTFGDSISFQLAFNLPAILSGDPSAFELEVTGPDGLNSVFPFDPSTGYNVEMTFDAAGNIITSNTAPRTIAITPAVPEPGSIILLATVISLVVIRKRRVSVLG